MQRTIIFSDQSEITMNRFGDYIGHKKLPKKIDDEIFYIFKIIERKIFNKNTTIEDPLLHLSDIHTSWIAQAGIDSESPINKKCFEKLLVFFSKGKTPQDAPPLPDKPSMESPTSEMTFSRIINYYYTNNTKPIPTGSDLNKLLYYFDFEKLVKSFQKAVFEGYSLALAINDEFQKPGYFDKILKKEKYTGTRTDSSKTIFFAHKNLLFINLSSQMGYITKIIYETNNTRTIYDKYKEMECTGKIHDGSEKLFKKGHLIQSINETIFKNCNTIKSIKAFRNQIIHNGRLNFEDRLYTKYEKGTPIERFTLIPDIDPQTGGLENIKERTNFYGNETKWNEFMPKLLEDYYKRLHKTLVLLTIIYEP